MANNRAAERPVIRPQYHFRKVGDQTHIWDVRKLAELVAEHPIIDVPLTSIREIHEPYWFADTDDAATCARIMAHAEQVAQSDLAYPIILCHEGRIMDGMHRVMKAHGLGHLTITARKFNAALAPDFVDIAPADLPY